MQQHLVLGVILINYVSTISLFMILFMISSLILLEKYF
ncbi:hypothetical protein CQA75_07565 [Campylobacter taeniopygiae]|uniref:Uncharacterized protein n=1 Tax=Campylobacter taeniopygiae TaxID=2510188 RepID=A0ABY2THF7_9BACT|nr:hypothetical protein CQA75_07565 [Campylobacter taeniopygiae]